MRRLAVSALPALLACGAGTGAAPNPDDASATPQVAQTGAVNPAPDSGTLAKGSPESGTTGPADEAGTVQNPDATAGPAMTRAPRAARSRPATTAGCSTPTRAPWCNHLQATRR